MSSTTGTMRSSTAGAAIAAALGLAIAGGVGYLMHEQAKTRSEQRALAAVVGEASTEMRAALKGGAGGSAQRIDEGIAAAKSWSDGEAAEAAEGYLIAAREIVRRRADIVRLQAKAASSRGTLAAHMASAERRSVQWIHTALELKKQVERDHFDLDVALNGLGSLLDQLPGAERPLAARVPSTLLLEDDVRIAARKRTAAQLARADAELARARSILPR